MTDVDKIESITTKLSQAADELKAMIPDDVMVERVHHEIMRAITTVFDIASDHGIEMFD